MKKAIMVMVAALGIACAVTAQSKVVVNPAPQWGQSLTVTGKLELVDGMIGIRAEGTVYYTSGLGRLAGFVPAMQEGATATVTGYSFPLTDRAGYARLAVTKLTLAGKDYDLGTWYRGRCDGRTGRRR